MESEHNKKESVADWIWNIIESGETYSVISAYAPGNSVEVNKINHANLENAIILNKSSYKEFCIKYTCPGEIGEIKTERKFFFITNMSYGTLQFLAEKYEQETVMVGNNLGLDVHTVKDEEILMTIDSDDMKLTWSMFPFILNNIKSKQVSLGETK